MTANCTGLQSRWASMRRIGASMRRTGHPDWPDMVRNADLQEAVFDAYRKDFVQFGFERSAQE
jgi:hypothetical protein